MSTEHKRCHACDRPLGWWPYCARCAQDYAAKLRRAMLPRTPR